MPAESGIYKIDGVRIIAASSQRAAMDSEGDTISSTYLKKADFTAASGKWEDAANEVTSNSANWNNSFTALTSTSSTWNDVTGKLGTAQYSTDSATFYTTANPSGFLTKTVADGYYVDTATYSTDSAKFLVASSITGKQDISAMTAYYNKSQTSGAQEITDALDNKQNTGYYITSADASLNDKMLVLKDNTWMELPEMGGFATATSAAGGVPDVQNPSTKLIYLVQTQSTGDDKWKEWIVTGTSPSTGWELIGDTSMDLSQYVTTASTASWDVTEYSGENGIYVTGHKIGLSSDYKTQIEAVSGKLAKSDFDTWSAGIDITPYTSVTPTIISINSTTNEVSGKDWTNDITATASQASANAVTTVEGKFGLTTDGKISSYNNSAIALPDMSEYQTTADMSAYLPSATYAAASGNWENTYNTVSTNSGSWTHTFTVVEVPNLSNIPDITTP